MNQILICLAVPFLGTVIGSALVYLMKRDMPSLLEKSLLAFAAGVMTAASVWSLLIPAFESARDQDYGSLAFLPPVAGFWAGMLFLLLLDSLIPHLHMHSEVPEGPKSKLDKNAMMVLAITLHNIPEGMAVGAVLAGLLSGSATMTSAGAFSLALGIAIQNIPEGAVVALPLRSCGHSRHRAFLSGTLSGAAEPLGAIATVLLAGLAVPVLPYMLSFAAGAMIYVVVEELIPEMSEGSHTNVTTLVFGIGFTLMMCLDSLP
ncbi:ZIP family metal transporter [Succinimonas amylolytica]|uniref:ZIP family metal transporter n=1 Tax=Succinimonas amylolytica TaxID=83769 RepID=UPI000374AE08|nr:ZIP family metal transporter [Succinimonas amylolytica]